MGNMPELLLRVGRLNYVWTNTESLLVYLITHLLGSDKETAVIVFLTLNTTRARIDLVERLAKRKSVESAERDAILGIMERFKKAAKVRNKYNHSIYSFDSHGDIASTQLMRLTETKDSILYGKVEPMDAHEMNQLEEAIAEITDISKELWAFFNSKPILKDIL